MSVEPATLEASEREWYSRHLLLSEVGITGQLALKQARVLIVGCGGLGAPASTYLSRAGVGTIGLVDFDTIDRSNLHRQILFKESDVGASKVDVTARELTTGNPHVSVVKHEQRLNTKTVRALVRSYDLVLDCTDNFRTRYILNDACVREKKPNIYASIFRFEGQVTVFDPESEGPCLRCLYPEPPAPESIPSCAEAGVLGVLPGFVGTIQASEALKVILKRGEVLRGRVLVVDAMRMRFRELKLKQDPQCKVCCGDGRVRYPSSRKAERQLGISAEDLRDGLKTKKITVVDVRSPVERGICEISGSVHVNLTDIESGKYKLNPNAKTVVYCKTGVRSQKAVASLKKQGFTDVAGLQGGILKWIERIDPSMAKY